MALFHHQTIRTHLPRAKPGTQSVSQRPVGRFYSTAVRQNPSDPNLSAATRRKNPPFPEKRGIPITICSTQYAERKLATGRAFQLDFCQAESIRHEFVRGDSPPYMSKGSMPRTGWPFSDR